MYSLFTLEFSAYITLINQCISKGNGFFNWGNNRYLTIDFIYSDYTYITINREYFIVQYKYKVNNI
jgi:hypothetical protein